MSVLAEAMAGSRPRTPAGRAVAALNRSVIHVVLGLVGVFWLVPTLGLLVTSFRPRSDIQA
ncbi:MAG TPA: sugar ABC transporter permease, partial [Chloroflexi bacterium]|nr:sugar ABC transporter permease [Chloroflexota bacterium]